MVIKYTRKEFYEAIKKMEEEQEDARKRLPS